MINTNIARNSHLVKWQQTCDDCGEVETVEAVTLDSARRTLEAQGWLFTQTVNHWRQWETRSHCPACHQRIRGYADRLRRKQQESKEAFA